MFIHDVESEKYWALVLRVDIYGTKYVFLQLLFRL